MIFSPRCSQPGDLRLKSVGLDGRQIEGFAEELARRPGVVIRQHPPSQFLEQHRPLLSFPPVAGHHIESVAQVQRLAEQFLPLLLLGVGQKRLDLGLVILVNFMHLRTNLLRIAAVLYFLQGFESSFACPGSQP